MSTLKQDKVGRLVSSISIVQKFWGDAAPPWVITLAEECDRSSQADVAKMIGRSPALVNQILRNKYKAPINITKERFEAARTGNKTLANHPKDNGRHWSTTSSIKLVEDAWGDAAPPWVIRMAEECDKSSQAAVAKKIGRSAALVNQVLKKTYKADLRSVQGRVETVLGCEAQCPVLGTISGQRCLYEQDQPYSSYNHVRVSLFRACRKCPRRIDKGDGHAE